MNWYLILQRTESPRSEWSESLNDHLRWMEEQHRRGTVVLSGPTPDRELGIYLVRAVDRKEAQDIANADPFTAAGCTYDLIEWEIHQILGAGFLAAESTTKRQSDG